MTKLNLLALIVAAPLAAMAQTAVFTDNFASSTTNSASVPVGTPAVSATSYDMASSKAATGTTNGPSVRAGDFKISLNAGTTSGFVEAQALFTVTPVSLGTVGDFINLTYTFTNTIGTLLAGGANSYIFNGLYNSGGSLPVAGTLANSGLTSSPGSPYGAGNCANWQGYVSRISNGSTSEAYTRPAQTNFPGGPSADQDLVGNGFGGGTFTNLTGVVFGGTETQPISLVSGSTYTISYTIALTAPGTITVTNDLFSGTGTDGDLIFSQTNTADTTNVLTTSFDGLAIGVRNSGTSFDPTMDISQIAITKSIFGTPGPSFNVTGGGAGCPGDAYLVNLSGSVTTNVYFLYTNGVDDGAVAPQTGTGSALAFGPISVVGTNTVVASNNVSGFTGAMSGSAVIAILPGPGITAEPNSVTAATGYAGIFTVVASGGGLNYQWYKNGTALSNGSHISGAQTATLTVFPVSAADAATTANGYYVIVTNTCGLAATSSPLAALTIDTPANIVWQGGNPNDNWDLATTPNFVNSSLAPVVFHSGDNVTFGDTSANPTVNLAGSFLDPSLIAENAGQSYVFAGSGTIAGPGALLMTGSGTLTISNANSFTGGTTIGGGDVVIKASNQQSLGTGTVTLAGGELEFGIASGSSTAFSNNINATANSLLQYDGAGTYALVLQGGLNGSPAATLTIQNYLNNSSTPDRVRLYGAFTNNAQLIINSAGDTIDLAPYNATGNQVYNGLISGTGGRILARGAGNLILNGANTFNDSGTVNNGGGPSGYSTFLSGGNVGVGADSVSNSGTLFSSPLGTGNLGIDVTLGNVSLFASGGAHTVANPIIYTSDTNTVLFTISGSNNLTLSGTFNLSGADGSGGTNQTIVANNTGVTSISGVITDNGLGCGLIKAGTNALYLDGINSYFGSTIVSNGMLAGIGTIAGPVTVDSTGTLAAGDAGLIGTLNISSNLTVGGNLFVRVDKALAPAQSNDTFAVTGILASTGTGTLSVSNLGPTLVAGDRFVLFGKPLGNGAALTVAGGGVNWTNHLAVDGSITVLATATTVNTNAFTITNSVANGVLKLAWPLNHTGYRLEAQTNKLSMGLSNNWVTVAGVNGVTPSQTNQVSIPVSPTNPAVYFRLIYP